jgi:hypothetical protein
MDLLTSCLELFCFLALICGCAVSLENWSTVPKGAEADTEFTRHGWG